jgi:hypothetical protein
MLTISEFNRLRITLLKPLHVVGVIALLAVVIGCSTPVIDVSPTEESITTSQSATAASLPTETSELTTITPEPISNPKRVDQSHPTQISPTATSVIAPTATEQATPTLTPFPTRVPTDTPEFIPAHPEPIIPAPPDRDLQELGKRLVPGYTHPKTVVTAEPLLVDDNVNFWVSRDVGSVIVNGTVSYISEHAYWVFETGYEPDPADIEEVASNFETDVWPAVTQVFGTPLTPGIDGDDRMVVYTAVLRSGVAGYFSAADSYPKEIRPHSNQREALYMSADRVNLSGTEYLSVIAHELQHATHFATDNSEDTWSIGSGCGDRRIYQIGSIGVRSSTLDFAHCMGTRYFCFSCKLRSSKFVLCIPFSPLWW